MADPEAPPIGSAAWLEGALRDRLGPGAVLGEITFAGRFLRVTGARAPLGRAVVSIEYAEIELGKGASLSPVPLAARLTSLRASIHAGEVRVDLLLSGGGGDAPALWCGSGSVSAGGITASIAGSIARDGDLRARADLRVERGDSRIDLDLIVDPRGALHASRLTGRLDLADLGALLTLPRDLVIGPGSTLDLDLDLGGSVADPHAVGRARAASLIVARAGREGSVRADDLTATLDLDLRRARYRDLKASAHGARVAGWGRVPFGSPPEAAAAVPVAALAVEQGGVGLIAALASLFGVPVRAARAPAAGIGFHLPADLAVDGEIMIRRDRSATGALAVTTPRTDLRLTLAHGGDGSLVGSTLRGRIDAEDAATIGLFPRSVRPGSGARAEVDARLGGTLDAPAISGRLRGDALVLAITADPAYPSIAVSDIDVLVDADRGRLSWHRLRGRFCGGTFASSGRVAFGDGGGIHAVVGFADVRVEQIPTSASGPSRLASLLHGAASGEVRLDRHGFGDAPLSARGEITVADPRYLAARDLTEQLARFGLPRLRTTGRGPLTARVRLAHRELFVDALRAAVEGVDLAGDVRASLDGRLDGRVTVDLSAAYLSASPLLAVPAAIAGRVTIPVTLAGTVSAPEIRTDARAILDELMGRSRIGDTLRGVVGDLRGAAQRGRSRRTKR